MRVAFGLVFLIFSVLLFSFPVLAQGSVSDDNALAPSGFLHSAVSHPASAAIGVLDSMMGALDAIPQYFIRIPGVLNGFQPHPDALSEGVSDAKLKGGLLDQLDTPHLLDPAIPVNVMVYPSFLPQVQSLVAQNQGQEIHAYPYGHIISARVPLSRLRALAQSGNVISIWPDRLFHASLDTSVDQVHAPVMWAAGYTGQGMKIAILDTGIDGSHPMLVNKVLHAVSFTGDSTADVIGHGTHVAGIAAGKQNGAGTYDGVSPDAKLFNVKVLGNNGVGAESWIVAGINYAMDPDGNALTDDGADVINLSLGGPYSDPNSPIVAAVQSAIANGTVVVVAAGNCGPDCPSSECQGFVGIETPGDAPDAITVGAVDDGSVHACFSSGQVINGEIKPDISAPGVGITSSYLNGSMISLSGTSMATPHVSGLLALLLQANPTLTPGDVKYILEQSSQDLGAPGKDTLYGSGLVDARGFLPSSVFTLQQYHLDASPSVVETNQSESFTLTSDSDTIAQLNIAVTHPNQLVESISMAKNGLTWAGSTSNTPEVGTYVVDANVEDIAGNLVHLQKSFVAQTPSTTGNISSYFIPVQVNYGQPVSASVQFQNTGTYDTEVLVELQEWKDDLFQRIRFSSVTPVAAGQTVTIPLSWTPDSTIGTKVMKLVATFDDTASEVDQNVEVVDADPPVIQSVNALSTSLQWNPLQVKIQSGDMTPLTGAIHVTSPTSSWDVPLITDPVYDFNQTLHGLIETPVTGNYSFTVEVCDGLSSGHCTTSPSHAFSVSSCTPPRALVVLGDQNSDSFSSLSSNYCLGFWPEPKQIPSFSFLASFPLLYWDAGTSYVNAVDENVAPYLQSYAGNIVLEGENVAFRHVNDDLMHSIVHADFNAKYSLDANSTNHLTIARPHLIFQGISSPLSFDLNNSRMNPDGAAPLPDAVSLAKWDANGSGIVAYQSGLSKRLFLSFSTRYLLPGVRQQLRTNIFQYMFLTTGPDATVDNSLPVFDPATFVYPGLFQSPAIIPLTQYLKSGSNTIAYAVKNAGDTAFTNLPFDVRVDGNTQVTPLVTANPGQVKRMNATFSFVPGYHVLQAIGDPNATVSEPNSLNNTFTQPIWVAPSLPNMRPVQVGAKYSNGVMSVKARIANYGSTSITQVPVRTVVDGNTLTFTLNIAPGDFNIVQRTLVMPKKNILVSVSVDPANILSESDESDNVLDQNLYFCTKSNILVVDDDDATPYVDVNASSVPVILQALRENGYCGTSWDESTQGVPSASTLNGYPIVIWSTGDYWAGVLDANDANSLNQYTGSVFFEGNDIGFDHGDDNVTHNLLHADMNSDLFLPSGAGSVQNLSSTIFSGLSSLDINASSSSFPDSVTPYNGGSSAGDWNGARSAIISYSQSGKRVLYSAFALDMVHSSSARSTYVGKAMDWLSLAGNQSPTAPTNLTCNGAACAGHYTGTLSLACSGSTDPENNALTYSLEAALVDSNASASGWWDVNWGHRIPIVITMSGDQNDFRTSVDLTVSTVSDPTFWSTVKADFGDVRFVKNGVLLPYFRSTYASGSRASYWIDFNAASGSNTIYLYFANPVAAYSGNVIPSDFFGTSHLVDNFNDNDISDWMVRSGTWTAQNGYLQRTDGQGSLDMIQKDYLQRGSSFYVRAKTHITSQCQNSNIDITRETSLSAPNYLDNFFGTWIDNSCPDEYQYIGIDNNGVEVTAGNSPQLVGTGSTIEAMISRTGILAAFANNTLNSNDYTVAGWADMNHWYPYAAARNYGGAPVELDDIYFGNAPGHAYDTNFSMGSSQTPVPPAVWGVVGTHDANATYSWNLSSLGTQSNVGLRCRAIDLNGSGFYSAYYTTDQNISIN